MLGILERKSKKKYTHNAEKYITSLKTEYKSRSKLEYIDDIKQLEEGKRIIQFLPEEIIAITEYLYKELYEEEKKINADDTIFEVANLVFSCILKSKINFTADLLERILNQIDSILNYRLKKYVYGIRLENIHLMSILKQIEYYKNDNELTNGLIRILEKLEKFISPNAKTQEIREYLFKIKELLGKVIKGFISYGSDYWSDLAIEDIQEMNEDNITKWLNYFKHIEKTAGGSPSNRWLKTAEVLINELGEEKFACYIKKWLIEASKIKNYENCFFDIRNSFFLKGIIWSVSTLKDNEIMNILRNLAEVCFHKIPNVGAISNLIGNACLYTLSRSEDLVAISHLAYLSIKIKYKNTRSLIDKALNQIAEKKGISRYDLEEIAIPDYELQSNVYQQSFGDYIVRVKINEDLSVKVFWMNEKGKEQKTIPNKIRESYSEEVKGFKSREKDIQKALSVNKLRIERLYLAKHYWNYKDWRARYIDHPLISNIGKKLIWIFIKKDQKISGIWKDDNIVDKASNIINWLTDDVSVYLWHPAEDDVQNILCWREYLMNNEIIQPFKQAYREIYVLTDAEINTNTYSNRFSCHILKQHQLNAICKQRDWQAGLLADFDSNNDPSFYIKDWDLTAQLYLEPADQDNYLSDTGIYSYVITDQVRFHSSNIRYSVDNLPLSSIPKIIFSEIMRDIDLFVSVTSVGNDPTWLERKKNIVYENYWSDYAFGELSNIASTRKQILDKLLSKLKISSQCRIEDRFLIVEGRLRTYKIHIGSGNILMMPDDKYLCIVQDRNYIKSSIYLPFEGDNTLSIILSKAFLLAEDYKIKDKTIISQICDK